MEDIWEVLNDEIPYYFSDIAEEFSFGFIKINKIETALANNKFALLISLDRFYIVVDYVFRDEHGELIKYNCDSFLAEKYDENDRKNLLEGKNAKEQIINEFSIARNGLKSKWNKVLNGNTDWFEDFKKSRWFSVSKLTRDEVKSLDGIIIDWMRDDH